MELVSKQILKLKSIIKDALNETLRLGNNKFFFKIKELTLML